MSKISGNIKKFRTACGMTQEDLANKIHVTRQTVSSWETNRTQPDLQLLQTLAEIFDIEVEELIYGKRKNTAEEKEKLLFGNTLVTVLSVLGCLLIGAGVVMIFIKYWRDFPDLLKLFSCFIPALLGQGAGIYTYIKKKESQAWCEGASVLWMLGTGVTTGVLISQVNTNFVNEDLVFLFLSGCFFALMLIFRTLAPLAVVHGCSLMWWFNTLSEVDWHYYKLDSSTEDIIRFAFIVLMQAVFIGVVFYASTRLYKKESNVIRYTFSQWINFAAIMVFVAFTVIMAGFEEGAIPFVALASVICFIIGEKHESFASPYRLLGTLVSAGALCFFSVVTSSDGGYTKESAAVAVLVLSLVPLLMMLHEKLRPKNRYLFVFVMLFTLSLFAFNLACLCDTVRNGAKYASGYYEALLLARKVIFNLNFVISLSGLVVLIVYGAKERKLLYLNLGFILSCVSVIAKLYLLDLGLIITGLLLIACGAGLLFINLKIARIREREKTASLEAGEGEEQ